jgi:CRISPR/Cas system-associated exonuclease Cas4 (RecB family)
MENAVENSEQNAVNELLTFTGTEVGYYFICHKKLWWFSHGVHMGHEHDRVKNEELDFLGP